MPYNIYTLLYADTHAHTCIYIYIYSYIVAMLESTKNVAQILRACKFSDRAWERGVERGEREREWEGEGERELKDEVSACLARCWGDPRRGRGYRDRHLWPANFSLSGNQSTVARQWLMLLLLVLLLLLLLADCSKVLAAPASPFGHSRLCSPGEILIYSLSLARLGSACSPFT